MVVAPVSRGEPLILKRLSYRPSICIGQPANGILFHLIDLKIHIDNAK